MMLTARIYITKIDYERSFQDLFPLILKKLEKSDHRNFAVRFLFKMGTESMTAVLGILELLDEEAKMEILSSIINLYGGDISRKINEVLARDETGKNVQIDQISISQEDGKLALGIGEVRVNYAGLLDNPSIQKKIGAAAGNMVQNFGGYFKSIVENNAGVLAKAAAAMLPEETEKLGLGVLRKPENKERLLSLAESALHDKGIWLELADIELIQIEDSPEESVLTSYEITDSRKSQGQFLSEEAEEKLLDAVVEYLKLLLAKET